MKQYDVIIIGGGMAGASLALALSGKGLRIILIEASQPRADQVPNYDDRAIALAFGSARILHAMGVWQDLRAQAEEISKIHVSELGGFGFARLDCEREGVPALGYVVTARDLGTVLLTSLARCDDIEMMAPASVIGIQQEAEKVVVEVESGGCSQSIGARLLVAADGGNSFVRRKLNLPVREWQYKQNAVVANISPSRPHENVAFERFTADGPVALLPMTGGRCGLVWTVADEMLEEVLGFDDAAFLGEVQRRFGWRLGRLNQVGARSSYPLSHLYALKTVASRVAVIGNAAHSLHPIAGQGFNLGIRDVAVLAELVLDAHRAGEDLGADELLADYEAWRKKDQQLVAKATDGLVRLFTNPLGAVRFGRNLGVCILDRTPFLRHMFARSAMGLHGRMPKLTRGVSLD